MASKTFKFGVPALAIVAIISIFVFTGRSASNAVSIVLLGNSSNFAVLAGSGITNTGATTVSGTAGGDMGSSPTPAFTGEASVTTTGTKYLAAEAIVGGAKAALDTAYLDAAGRASTSAIATDLGGQTLVGGVYTGASSVGLTGTLILDGANNPDSVWIFQTGSTLITASSSVVSLINGAQACNVFWQVGSSMTLGTGSNFVGHVFAQTTITDDGGSTVNGQLLARDAAVNLNNTTIINDACVTPSPSPTPTVSATPPSSGGSGGDTSTPTPTPTETPAAEATPTPEASTVAGGELPNTETPWVIYVVLGALIAAIGVVFMLQRRKRS
jgi:type VI secretion system secreted protein VgrG